MSETKTPKQVESPDDWVEITDTHPGHIRRLCDQVCGKYDRESIHNWHYVGGTVGYSQYAYPESRIRCRRKDLPVSVPCIKRVPVRLWINEEDGVLFASPDQVLASDQEILHDADGFFVGSSAEELDDMPLNPVPGKVVATGTVTFTPVKSPDDMAAIITKHTQQVRELTQRIKKLVQQVNERDAVIEKIRTALHQGYFL